MKNTAVHLENLFNPKSIAVVGASSDKTKVGYAVMSNLMAGAKREIYPVSISEKEVMGMRSYERIGDLPNNVDLAIIAVRADIVPQILTDCAAKNIRSVVIISAGFRETGPAGLELEEKCSFIAQNGGISLLGPNCLGTIDAHADFNCTFGAQKVIAGGIAFLSQSGALGTSLLDIASAEGVGFSKFISLGNEASLSEIVFLRYLANDPDTKAILIYLEKLSDGPAFMQLVSEISKSKPVVVLKAGRSERGIKAVMSHTGSLAPDDAVFTSAIKQSGAIEADSIRQFFNIAKLFQLGIMRPLKNLVILTNGGGPSVVASDLIDLSRSLSLVSIPEGTQSLLRKVMPSMSALGNPVDIIGDAMSQRYADALKIIAEIPESDGIILMLTPQMMTEAEATAKLVSEYRTKKAIIPVFIGGLNVASGISELQRNGLTSFRFPADAVEALDALALGAEKTPKKILRQATAERNLRMMSFTDTRDLLEKAGIKLEGVLIKEKNDLIKAVSKIGKSPYALKAMAPDIVHKTDAGAVRLGINTIEEANRAWDDVLSTISKESLGSNLEGMLVQQMGRGKEVIIGMKRDSVFGPTILCGLGGIFAEALRDASLRIAPVGIREAEKMIRELKGASILAGLRGQKPVDIGALARVIVKISELASSHPEIQEIDLNPVMVSEKGASVVDARIMIR